MKNLVVYFSRNGNSKRIAEKIKKKFNADIEEIKDDKNWNGVIGFIRGGFYATRSKTTEINYKLNTSEYDNVFVVSPIWAGYLAPAMYTYLLEHQDKIKNLHLIINNAGSSIEKAFSNIQNRNSGIKSKYGINSKLKNEDEIINSIVIEN